MAVDLPEYVATIRERFGLPPDAVVELRQGQFHDVVLTETTAYGWSVGRRAAQAVEDPDRAVNEATHIRATFALQQALPAALSGDSENLDDGLEGYR